MLDKTLKFSTTRMQYAQDNQEDFTQVVMQARRVKGKEWTNEFGQHEVTQPSDYRATNKAPINQ